MQPGKLDLTLTRGDSFELYFRIRNPSPDGGVTPGDYKDLTGYTGKAQIRTEEDATEVLAELGVTIPDQTVAENLGGVLITLTKEQAADLPVTSGTDTHTWDIQLTKAAENQTYLKGKVKVNKDTTR